MTSAGRSPRVLVIGYGSTLRGDDGVGQQVAGQLAQRVDPDEAQVIVCHQLTAELAEPVSRAKLVLLVDASTENPPGTIACEEVRPTPKTPGAFWHYVEPGALLAAAQAWYGRAPRALLWTVGGQSFDYGEGLSPAVEQAVPGLVTRLCAIIQDGPAG